MKVLAQTIATLAVVQAQNKDPIISTSGAALTGLLLEGEDCTLHIRGCQEGTCCNDGILKDDVDENGDMPSDYYERMVSICAKEGEVEWTSPFDGDSYWLTPLDICIDGGARLAASAMAIASAAYILA